MNKHGRRLGLVTQLLALHILRLPYILDLMSTIWCYPVLYNDAFQVRSSGYASHYILRVDRAGACSVCQVNSVAYYPQSKS